ncbi:hypothetical protein [Streptacidiphilus neutrinimicus]|uniref:hypothetical protein n=1 Tax=Streptacidiphilus neutrinimicus TaxID=105420 RepID=UPI0005A8FD7B|nr:hypothetical protein [Streptacidiphilus neutrinimicus]
MTTVSFPLPLPVPVHGLDELTTETRVIATPWSRMVRGIGLGQHPVAYDPEAAGRIRHVFRLLDAQGAGAGSYTRFSSLLADFVLTTVHPSRGPYRRAEPEELGPVLAALRAEENPYFRVMAGCLLADAVAKLGLPRSLLVNDETDLPAELLDMVDRIEPDRARDENAGRHGHYERLSACTAVFLATGQLGLGDRLVSGPRNRVREALDLLEQVPAPFFRGRGGSMLLSVVSLLGHERLITDDGGRDRLREVLSHLDHADGPSLRPAFPQPMSDAFVRIYPLLTMLNAVAMTERPETYLSHGRDRLAEAAELMAALTPVERTHMGLYYLVALHNLGRLRDQVPDLDAFVEDVVGQGERIDPGADYFLRGISYAYLVQTAMFTGRMDLVGEPLLNRWADAFPDLDRTDDDRTNRPYPFAYALNVLAEIGRSDLLFSPRPGYGGATPVEWVVGRLSEGGREEHRLYMLNHALVSWALRLRGTQRRETPLFAGVSPFRRSGAR